MIPKSFYDKKNIPVENGNIFVLMSEGSKTIYENSIVKAADIMEFKCHNNLQEDDDWQITDTLEWIKKAELVIADLSDPDTNLLMLAGAMMTARDEDHILFICRLSSSFSQIELNR